MTLEVSIKRMRKIFLSFSPRYYDILRDGSKIFEYRKRFCDEEVLAYIYLGKPVQQVVAIAQLGKRIELKDWYNIYSDVETKNRIIDYMSRNKYAMPILMFQEINPISIAEIKSEFPNFYIPLSFRNLNSNDMVTKYIEDRTVYKGEKITHDFTVIDPRHLCEM